MFSLLTEFGDAEIAIMILPRTLIIEACRGPEVEVASPGGRKGVLSSPGLNTVNAEVARALQLVDGLGPSARIDLIASVEGQGPFGSEAALTRFLDALNAGGHTVASRRQPGGNDDKHYSATTPAAADARD